MPKSSSEVTRRLLGGSRLLILIALTGAGSPRDAANKVTKTAAPKSISVLPSFSLPAVVPTTNTVTLAWDASTSASVLGYKIYYGPSSRTYTNSVDVLNVLTTAIERPHGSTNYYAVTAYDLNDVESDYSTEVSLAPVRPIPTYGLIFLQASTNGTTFYDLSSMPYLRLTNGAGGPLPWQWFRSRTENTMNWR